MYRYILLLTSLAFSFTGQLKAQEVAYPVTAAVQTLPPFSLNLADWVDPFDNRLAITLLLNDREEPSYQVRLRFTIIGPGLEIRTNENWQPNPITLNYGIVEQLTGADLADYFNLDHIDFLGYSRQAYLQNGGLPEGTYSICVEAFDYNRIDEGAASIKACSFVQAQLLDPPVVLSPEGFQTPLNPQNLLVQWQARHTATFLTNYRVEIYQFDPNGNLTPEQIYSLQQPYIEAQTDGITAALIDNSFPLLSSGEYLLRVQALDPNGVFNFKNGGYSAPVFFSYGSECVPPDLLTASVDSYDQATIGWEFVSGAASYILRFREANPNANWYEEVTIFNSKTLSGLQDNTTYEVQVQSVCDGTPGPFGQLFEFTTEEIPFDPETIDCTTSLNDIPRPANTQAISSLNYNDNLTVGGFTMRVTSAEQNEDAWNGTGQIFVPWMGQRINCRFKGLYVNTDSEIYDGTVIAVVDPTSSSDNDDATDDAELEIDFCGQVTGGESNGSTTYNEDLYASGNSSYYEAYLPYDPNRPNREIDTDLFYNQYNPNNPSLPYLPYDYSSSRNPYTEENPYDPLNMWNPWNAYNSYDYTDYDDPVNPWTEDFIWTAERMFVKQQSASSADDSALWTGGINLPIELGSDQNLMALSSMKFTATGAFLNADFSGTLPIANQELKFKAVGIGITPQGVQGEAKMQLMNDLTYNWSESAQFSLIGGTQTYIKFDCQGINEVSLKLEAQLCPDLAIAVDPVTFKRDSTTYVKGSSRILASGWGEFSASMTMTPFEVPALDGWTFQVENAIVDLSTSFTENAVTFPFNYEYLDEDYHPDLTGGAYPTWEGFYLGNVTVSVPNELTGRDSTDNTLTINANNIIIDRAGFSGDIFATNVLTLDQGKLDSWAFAIDSISIGAVASQFHHLSVKGQVKVPPVDQPLAYNCHIQPNKSYNFSVALTDTLSMSCFAANVDLYDNTKIGLSYRIQDGKITAFAELHGQITVKPTLGDGPQPHPNAPESPADTTNQLRLPYVSFEGFKIRTTAPYIQQVGNWGISTGGSQGSAAGFPISINDVGMMQNEDQNEVAIGIDLTLNLVKPSDMGFGANGRAFVICDVSTDENGTQDWKFKRLRLDKLGIDYTGAGFAFKGYLQNFEKNLQFGTGFQGGIQAAFTPGISISVAALFGKVNGYRYFFADALLAINPGIPLGTSGMALYGFGGGVSYHLERQSFTAIDLPYSEAEEVSEEVPEEVVLAEVNPDLEQAFFEEDPAANTPPFIDLPEEIGQTLSGVRYLPNEDIGIGIKAMVAFGAIKREVFNGDITFEIIFNDGGGLNYIGLSGNANFMTPPRTAANPSPSAAVSFYADMGYNFIEKSFDAYLRLQVNVPPGVGVLRGSYSNFVAGEGQIHASADDWFVYLGTPQQPVSLSLDFSALKNISKTDDGDESDPALPPGEIDPLSDTSIQQPLGSIDDIGLILTAYLDAGTSLPAFPPPPQQVMSILGDVAFDEISREDPAFANATGILLGASLSINMPKLKFLIFYAQMSAGIGFDVMLKNYGTDARCSDDIDNPDPIGFNGWYAQGQIFGYLEGSMGIEVKLGRLSGKFEILKIGAAALLQTKLPNPFWAKGAMAAQYRILGGLIKGRVKFDFEVGTFCSVVIPEELGIEIIQALVPSEGTEEPSVFTKPQALFAIPVNQTFALLDPDNNYVELKPELTLFRVVDTETNQSIPGSIQWSENNLVAAFRPDDILLGNHEYRIDATVLVMQRAFGEQEFSPYDAGTGTDPNQSLSVTFTTGSAPNHIVEENVRYAYPINRQTNFLRLEANEGYIQLAQGQDLLFHDADEGGPDPEEWEQKMRLWQDGQPVASVDYSYDTLANRVHFSLPGNNLANSKISFLELVDQPIVDELPVDHNVGRIVHNLANGQVPEDNDTEILLTEQEAQGILENKLDKQIYRLDFRTSAYSTFTEKMAELNQQFDFIDIQELTESEGNNSYLSIKDFGIVVAGEEGLDKYDLKGENSNEKKIDPLLRGRANLNVTADNWYNTDIGPNVYELFPYTSAGSPTIDFNLNWRNILPLEEPPIRSAYIASNSTSPLGYLEDYHIGSGSYYGNSLPIQLRYHIPYIMYRDYGDYWNQVLNYTTQNELPSGLDDWLNNWQFKYPKQGFYEMKIDYVLPGTTEATSTVTYQLPYFIDNQ